MSGIAAIYHRDGQPVDPAMLERMVQAMAHRGPDGITSWINGSVGLGHCVLHTTPESLKEHDPICDDSRSIVWDGRLDNRKALIETLSLQGIGLGAETDPELVLGAYRLWGKQCAEHLLGDFAFVVWEESTRSLFGARDRIGLKPLYYCQQGERLLIASEAKALLSVLDRMPQPDDELILAMLLSECREQDNHRSLFAGIKRLPPGHIMVVKDGQLRIERYWQINPTRFTVYKQPEAYVEQFLALFQEAVRCRTRSAFPIGCHLSGGLDSSSMTILAASSGRTVEAFTGFSEDLAASDERIYAREVCKAAGIPLWEFRSQRHDPLEGLGELLWIVECPLVGIHRDSDGFRELVGSRTCRVVLDGEAADQLMDEHGYLADVLLHRGPLAFLRETHCYAQWYQGPAWEFAEFAVKGLLPTPVKFLGKRILGRIPPSWINPDLARAIGLTARIRQSRVPLKFPHVSQTLSYQEALGPYMLLKLELDERYGAWFGQEFWSPFLDSRLVEFVLSIPWNRRCQKGERRWLLRQAMKGILPEDVRLRQGKGDWTAVMDQALIQVFRLKPPEPLANRSGMMARYIDFNGARKLLEQYLKGRRRFRWELWTLVTLDYWLKRFWKEARAHVGFRTIEQEALQFAKAAQIR